MSESDWDAFVLAHPRATLYHTWRWSGLAAEAFGFTIHRFATRDAAGRLTGALPLIEQTGWIMGRRLVSLPFVNYGGPIGDTADVERSLIQDATELARRCRAAVFELRDSTERPEFHTRKDKATVELALPASADELGRCLGAKLRAQVKRADRESPVVACGGAELLDAFYGVFAAAMRDLGTPVYPRRFFALLLERAAADCSVVVIRLNNRPAAAALLTHFRDRTEIPWAASLRAARATSVNMRLYWECLLQAIGRGSRVFDFGRSTVDSGTYRFKLQWGGRPRPLYWAYPLRPRDSVQSGEGRLLGWARAAWTRLPLPLANRLGPLISPGLPW
ncbi:MAG: FemAB family XrtA/PEP-CTERM system-associated protein [Gammaproteobacteria bacterium]